MSDLDRAIKFATDAHSGQVDKAGEPYILHPIRVMISMQDEDARVAAVLHDTVEDSAHVGHGDILAIFGATVHEAVFALSRQPGETYSAFIERCKINPIARSVKIADVLDNLSASRSTSLPEQLRIRYLEALRALQENGK